ncbi:hypothetical protein [Nonomuraea sp. WAC 01424]|uniref:hypothetical protein n=1 Tax=Nonomuraea sp. WAC 01424 TaxID=2203200 RepID=UPI00163BBB13|nr:hypothetical protein [Nonomuraea sp. WAC 01424]
MERLGRQLAVWAERTEAGEGLAGVREAFARLSPDDREILAPAGWEGLGSDEITVAWTSTTGTCCRSSPSPAWPPPSPIPGTRVPEGR